MQHMDIKYGLECSGFESRHGRDIFLSSKTYKQPLGPTLPPKQYVPGSFSGVKRTGHEFSLFPSSDVVKNEWS